MVDTEGEAVDYWQGWTSNARLVDTEGRQVDRAVDTEAKQVDWPRWTGNSTGQN